MCATLPLLLLGAEVTTKKIGMVDPVGFRAPWHLLTVPLEEMGLGYLIEHSHRVAGFIVGTCAIVLAVGLGLQARSRWLRWLGLAALLGVCMQGVLGILRVNLNALAGRDLAFVHGLFAQLVFALLVSLILFTSRTWTAPTAAISDEVAARLRRAAVHLVGLVYLQIIFGALLRHTESPLGPRLHLFTASAVVATVAWMAWLVYDKAADQPALKRTVGILVGLVTLQVVLGIEAWLAKFPNIEWPQLRPLVVHPEVLRSVHYLVGALLFSGSVVLALQVRRGRAWSVQLTPQQVGQLKGAS